MIKTYTSFKFKVKEEDLTKVQNAFGLLNEVFNKDGHEFKIITELQTPSEFVSSKNKRIAESTRGMREYIYFAEIIHNAQ